MAEWDAFRHRGDFGGLGERFYGLQEYACNQLVGTATTSNTLYGMPLHSGPGGTIDLIQMDMSGGASANTSVRVGIYAANAVPNILPGALLLDVGCLGTAATGIKQWTLSLSLAAFTLYWVGLLTQANPTFFMSQTGITRYPLMGFDATSYVQPAAYLAASYSYQGSMPNPYPTSAWVVPNPTGAVPWYVARIH